MDWIEGYIEIDATVTPSRVKGILVMAETPASAEEHLQALLRESGLGGKRESHLPPLRPDHQTESVS